MSLYCVGLLGKSSTSSPCPPPEGDKGGGCLRFSSSSALSKAISCARICHFIYCVCINLPSLSPPPTHPSAPLYSSQLRKSVYVLKALNRISLTEVLQ